LVFDHILPYKKKNVRSKKIMISKQTT